MDAPGYRKPTHSYGLAFGTSPDTADENWAGAGYAETPALEVLEPVDQPA